MKNDFDEDEDSPRLSKTQLFRNNDRQSRPHFFCFFLLTSPNSLEVFRINLSDAKSLGTGSTWWAKEVDLP